MVSPEQLNELVKEITGHELNDIQKEALKRLDELLKKEHDKLSGIIAMPTGTGKTRLAFTFLLYLFLREDLRKGDKVLWLAPLEILLDQAKEEGDLLLKKLKDLQMQIYTPISNELWETKGKHLQYLLKDEGIISVVIPTTPQLLNRQFSEKGSEFKDMITEVYAAILDEVHHTYWGPEIRKVIETLQEIANIRFILGLSATPTKEAKEALGEPVYSCSTRKAMDMGILMERLKIYRTITKVVKDSIRLEEKDRFSEPVWRLDEWQVAIYERAEKYAEKIIEVLKKEVGEESLKRRIPKTLVVAANTGEADLIKKELDSKIRDLCHRNNLVSVAHYNIDEAEEVLSEFRKKKEGILVTVDMAKMGFDDKNLEVLIIARPVRSPLSYIQIRGRVLRKPDEKAAEDSLKLRSEPYAVLIDFTEASRHENVAERVEIGKSPVGSSEIKKDLEGYGEVPLARGEVKVGEFETFEIGSRREGKVKEKPVPATKEDQIPFYCQSCDVYAPTEQALVYECLKKSQKLNEEKKDIEWKERSQKPNKRKKMVEWEGPPRKWKPWKFFRKT